MLNTHGTQSTLAEFEALLTGFWLTDLSNFVAYLNEVLPRINWVGFYFSDLTKLRLGPFAGKAACTEIAFNRGVCGKAFSTETIQIIPDVHEFPGHIACDARSRSELVIPFYVDGNLIGVLDVDSPELNRFTQDDARFLSEALQLLAKTNPVLSRISSLMEF